MKFAYGATAVYQGSIASVHGTVIVGPECDCEPCLDAMDIYPPGYLMRYYRLWSVDQDVTMSHVRETSLVPAESSASVVQRVHGALAMHADQHGGFKSYAALVRDLQVPETDVSDALETGRKEGWARRMGDYRDGVFVVDPRHMWINFRS